MEAGGGQQHYHPVRYDRGPPPAFAQPAEEHGKAKSWLTARVVMDRPRGWVLGQGYTVRSDRTVNFMRGVCSPDTVKYGYGCARGPVRAPPGLRCLIALYVRCITRPPSTAANLHVLAEPIRRCIGRHTVRPCPVGVRAGELPQVHGCRLSSGCRTARRTAPTDTCHVCTSKALLNHQ